MKGGIFKRSECCDGIGCECPVCLEVKPLMRLNCDHYVCLDDIRRIINSNPLRLQRCPICRTLITSYGCNGNITNVENNIIPSEDEDTENEQLTITRPYVETDDELIRPRPRQIPGPYVDTDEEIYHNRGGKRRKTRKRKKTKTKTKKTRKTKKRRKIKKQ